MVPLLLLFLSQCRVMLSQSFTNNDTYWASSSTFVPTFNTSYGALRMHNALRMQFSFIFYGKAAPLESELFENMFRIGWDGKPNCKGAGTRYPSAWILDKEEKLMISISHTKQCYEQS